MSFSEEFHKLDPDLFQRAIARVSERQMAMVKRELHVEHSEEMFNAVQEASPGFMAIVEWYEETIQMLTSLPEGPHGPEVMQMTEMMMGALAVGEALAEYARLESES